MTMRTLVFALLLAPLAAAAQVPETLFNLVNLSAQAEREIPNDLLTTTLAAEAEGVDPAQLADGINRTMQRALATARAATLQAARDLYGAGTPAERAVAQAWTAVGVN